MIPAVMLKAAKVPFNLFVTLVIFEMSVISKAFSVVNLSSICKAERRLERRGENADFLP
jgi:hypothetical protein